MFLNFHLHYRTAYGEQIGIQYSSDTITETTLYFQTTDGENWFGLLELKDFALLKYKYVLFKNDTIILREWGKDRSINGPAPGNYYIEDKWRPRADEANAFLSTAFTKSIFRREITEPANKKSQKKLKNTLTFCLHSAMIQPHLRFGIIGNIPELGSWIKPVWMDETEFPLWKTTIQVDSTDIHLEYKYVVMDTFDSSVKIWEDGHNRKCHFVLPQKSNNHIVITDEKFQYKDSAWRGAGVAFPVFSLRSHQGFGIGEFSDLKLLTDWAHKTGMKIIQVLPVNDTIANKTWQDSYPYAAISVFGLHPLYIHIQSIAHFKSKSDHKAFINIQTELNKLSTVDFEKVLEAKFRFLKILFNQEYTSFIQNDSVLEFIQKNEEWLKPYAAFCHLRDKNATCNFNEWPEFSEFSPRVIEILCSQDYKDFKEIQFYYFIQYHADKQLTEARDYARSKSVVIKGDLPIGIYRYSCDAWMAPQLFNMNEQAGAPPDDYATLGQNWGFPTYNWSVMANDDFLWWKKRMQMLNRYFDALRIDHILGFFRIWQIPFQQIEGTMGMFNPRLPLSADEIRSYGIQGDLSRYYEPYITEDLFNRYFGKDAEKVFNVFFTRNESARISFKSTFATQKQIASFIGENPDFKEYEKQLLNLLTEVLLIPEPGSNFSLFNPRITLNTTISYAQLDENLKSSMSRIHDDYFFHRHDEYWRQQALWKLPAILDASDMLICGEDLGMIPNSVPGVMKEMNIMTLEIQRMPKGNTKFGQVRSYPYFSVCSPSCHDMSTIRGWWENDHENAKDYYYNYLHWHGLTPMVCSENIVQTIIEDHLASPSMLAIFPVQDLVGMDMNLRRTVATEEQINEPSNPKHYWKFRFHIPVEDLIQANELNEKIKVMVLNAAR